MKWILKLHFFFFNPSLQTLVLFLQVQKKKKKKKLESVTTVELAVG